MMRGSVLSACLAATLLTVCSIAQDMRVIRVGVPVMKNDAGRSVPGNLERDRLVKAFNDLKPDKKLHVKVQAIALDGMNPAEVFPQAEQKRCDYIVYTTLTELRAPGDPVQHRPGTFETNSNSQWGTHGGESSAMNPEFRATVEYKLYRTGDPSEISSGPFSTQETMPEIDVVSQVMGRIANRVFAEVKKAGSNPP